MQEQDDLFADAARQLLQGECTPARVRAIEAGGSPRALWESLEQAGFADALVPEDAGGAGLALAQLFDVWSLAGAHALPVPLGETMLARALLAGAGVERPQAAIALAEGLLQPDGSLHCAPVRLGAVAGSVLVQHGQGWSLLPVAQAQPEKAAFCLDVNLRWSAGQVRAAPSLGIALPDGLDLRTLQACLVAAQLAGALMEVFQRTLQYANDRQQFGRPIAPPACLAPDGRLRVVLAWRGGCRPGPWPCGEHPGSGPRYHRHHRITGPKRNPFHALSEHRA
jgi:acyl-CoA dehydrogenase